MDPNINKIAKKTFAALVKATQEDAKHYERLVQIEREASSEEVKHLLRKAKKAREALAIMKQLYPILLKLLEPPKFTKFPRYTKKQLAKMRAGMPVMASPAPPVTSH